MARIRTICFTWNVSDMRIKKVDKAVTCVHKGHNLSFMLTDKLCYYGLKYSYFVKDIQLRFHVKRCFI